MPRPEKKSLLSVLLSRLGKPQTVKTQKAEARPAQLRPFQAISIFRGTLACPTARKFSEYRFLAKDAPPLPLSGCTMRETCQCRYLKHKDRRVEARRLIAFGLSPTIFDGRERRVRGGRRSSD